MLKEQFMNFKNLILKNDEGNNKKKIENLVVFVIILIITIIVINIILKDNNEVQEINDTNTLTLASKEVENTKVDLESSLENILSNIDGVGTVKVLITYSETSQTVAMYNEDTSSSNTEETDKTGGNRKITESSIKKEVIYKEINGEKIPVTQSIIQPKAEGAIITAQGASNVNIKTNIIQAVEAVTGLATHKIQVFEMKK